MQSVNATNVAKLRVVKCMDLSSLPSAACLFHSACGHCPAGCSSVFDRWLVVPAKRPNEVSLFETAVLTTLTEGFTPATANRAAASCISGIRYRGQYSTIINSVALVDRYISASVRTVIQSERTQQDIVLELLEHLNRPARHAADGEDRHKEIAFNAQQVIHDARVEIDVHIYPVPRIRRHGRHHRLEDLEPFRLAHLL